MPYDPTPFDADVFDHAADLIEDEGWWDGSYDPPTDGVNGFCALMAVGYCLSDVAEPHRYVEAFAEFLDVGFNDIPKWNDSRIDAGEVTRALRKCAEELRTA